MKTLIEETVNLNKITNPYSRIELYKCVAKVIADDTLEYINAHSLPVIPRVSFYTKYGKRMLDFIFALAALIITFPINLIIAIFTFIDVGRPIFFKQQRSGKDGKPFTIIKFRNMTNERDENGDLLPASQRVTKFGRFVRKTSLDELLNFWNVLKGDMSIIGPRPLDSIYEMRYSERHKMRMAIRPGLECPLIRHIEHKLTWEEQFENDIFYIENVSFKLDIKMFFALIRMVFDSKRVALRSVSLRGSFMGYRKDGKTINSQMVPILYLNEAMCLMERKIEIEKDNSKVC